MAQELLTTASILLTLGLLLASSALFSRASNRAGIPVFLLFLVIGMLAGSEGIGGIAFEDYRFAFRLGTVALALILFDGGLNTHLTAFRQGVRPAAALATAGVVGTALVVAGGARLLGFSWPMALLVGAVVSPTDAAAVFSVLRGSGTELKRRLGPTLEIESGLNDPMAVILTLVLTEFLAAGHPVSAAALLEIPLQLGLGTAVGLAAGFGGRRLLRASRLPAGGLYPVLTLALALLTFGLASVIHGSGFLAVYLAAVVIGNGGHGELPYRSGLIRFHDAAAWFGQVAMFLMLGLLVFPSRLIPVAGTGLALALLLALVARPLAVFLCLLPFRYTNRERLFLGWVGLRGAVPIILATFPVLAGVEGAEVLFNVVFFVVVVSAFIPGGTVAWAARRLDLAAIGIPTPHAVLEVNSMQPLEGEIVSFYVDPALPVAGVAIADIPFPPRSAAMLIVRGTELLAPRGDTPLQPGDHVYVVCSPEDRPFIELLFGRPEQ